MRFKKPLNTAAGVVFALIAVRQFVRMMMGWEVTVSGAKVPVWVSTTTTLAAVVLAVLFWRKGRQ